MRVCLCDQCSPQRWHLHVNSGEGHAHLSVTDAVQLWSSKNPAPLAQQEARVHSEAWSPRQGTNVCPAGLDPFSCTQTSPKRQSTHHLPG